jgi:DNA-binding transcriptional LysR family regulator
MEERRGGPRPSAGSSEGRLERVLPSYRFQPLDVYALIPKGRIRLARVSACVEALRSAVRELA